MDLYMQRAEYRPDGILSEISDVIGPVLVTLEHAFLPQGIFPAGISFGHFGHHGQGDFLPKIPPGIYTCVRGPHRLEGMTEDFETFEVTGVAGHSGLLFHWGNWNRDSDGCILVGEEFDSSPCGEMLTNSRATFDKFMALQDGVDSFQLEVRA
jgi:hypothetical protein